MLFIQVHVILAVVTRTFDISLFDLLIKFIRTVREHPKFVPLLHSTRVSPCLTSFLPPSSQYSERISTFRYIRGSYS